MALEFTLDFKYAVGTPEELVREDFDSLGLFEANEALNRYLEGTGRILTPQFIGVYQFLNTTNAAINTDVNSEEGLKEIAEMSDVFGRGRESLNFLLNNLTGQRDLMGANLIHIAYSSDWNLEATRLCFRDPVGRVKFSRYDLLPNFSKKQEIPFNAMAGLVEDPDKLPEVDKDFAERFRARITEQRNALKSALEIYGLSHAEYLAYRIGALQDYQ